MCTGLSYINGDFYFGRNMDIECGFGERVVITPRNYKITYKATDEMVSHYAMIGMATVISDYPLYAEAVNEYGLGIAGLNFPDNAFYSTHEVAGKTNITPYEVIPWTVGQFKTVKEVREAYQSINLVGIDFMEGVHVSPLHWIIADKEETIVLESTAEGIRVYDDPVGVLTNNPTFDYHMLNLKNYMGISTEQPENSFAKHTELTPFGQGLGAFGLPGDFSPASRFIKAAFIREHAESDQNEEANVAQFFHILDSVAMVEGTVVTPQDKNDITLYACCVNGRTGDYYYKTYSNNQITVISMQHEDLEANVLKTFELEREQNFSQVN